MAMASPLKSAAVSLAAIALATAAYAESASAEHAKERIARTAGAGSMINAREFLPPYANHFRYMSSSTTPPCSEGVNRFVIPGRIEVSREQVEQFTNVIGADNRPVQKINNHLISAPRKVR